MFRIALRNILIMLGVALPILLVTGPLVGWMLDWAFVGARGASVLTGLPASFLFWYPIWALPTLGIAAIHQLVLVALPHDWPARTTRLAILGTSLVIVGLIASYVASASSKERGLALAVALLPAAVAYGVLVKPLRPPASERYSGNEA